MIQIKNNSSVDEIILVGVRIAPEAVKTLDKLETVIWSNDSTVLSCLASGQISLLLNTSPIINLSEAIDILKSEAPTKTYSISYPFADKKLLDGKKLFTRVHGIQGAVTINQATTVDFNVPYSSCKITGIEIIGGDVGDFVDFKVTDTPSGTISTVPNLELNQFGFSVNVASNFYEYRSNYDADLIQHMKVRIVYTSTSSKIVGFNIILHQVV